MLSLGLEVNILLLRDHSVLQNLLIGGFLMYFLEIIIGLDLKNSLFLFLFAIFYLLYTKFKRNTYCLMDFNFI